MANVEGRVVTQDPSSRILRGLDWSAWLASGDTILRSSWTVPPPLTLVSSTATQTVAQFMVTGGTSGKDYEITNRIETKGGEANEKSVKIKVREG